jgi:hypothetical protein
VAINAPQVDWLAVVLDGLRATLLVQSQNLRLPNRLLLNPLNGRFPLLDKVVAASPPKALQLLNGVVLPVLLLNVLKNVVRQRLLKRLELLLVNGVVQLTKLLIGRLHKILLDKQ